MRITDMARVMNPEDLERHIARVLANGAAPLGRMDNAWHITDRIGMSALIICKHMHSAPADVIHLNTLMSRYNIPRGYLVTPGKFNERTRNTARLNRAIILLDGDELNELGGDP